MTEFPPGGPGVPPPLSTDEPERRRDLRVPLRVLKVKTESSGEIFFGYATNVSTTGMFIQSSNPKAPGTRLRLAFGLGTAGKLTLAAEVIWSREFTGPKSPTPGMGIRFLELSPEAREQIAKFVGEP